jgi:hypothetical protein
MFRLLFASVVWAVLGTLAYAGSTIACANPGSATSSGNASSINANSCLDFSATVQGANNWSYGYYTSETASGVVNPSSTVYPPILDPKSFTSMTPTPLLGSNGQILPNQYLGVWSQDFFQYWTSLDAFGGHSNGNYTDLHTINTAPGEPWVWVPGMNSYCNFSGTGYYNCNPIGGYDPLNPNSPDDGNYWATRRYEIPTGFTGQVSIGVTSQRQFDIPNSQAYTDYVIEDSNGVVTDLGSLYVPGNASTSQVFSDSFTANVTPGTFIDFVIVPAYGTFDTYGQPPNSGYADFASGQYEIDTITGVNSAGTGGMGGGGGTGGGGGGTGGGSGPTPPSVPEPATTALVSAGLLLLGFLRRR